VFTVLKTAEKVEKKRENKQRKKKILPTLF